MGLPTGVPVGNLPSSIVSEVLATATNLPSNAANIPISNLPSAIQSSLNQGAGGLTIPTSFPLVPVTQLPESVVSEVLATATGLPADASNIPLTDLPSDIQTAVSSA